MMFTDPIVIGGAGPAGSACAIRLAQLGHATILLDQCAFPRKKLCGEFLGPDALPYLRALGVLDIVRSQAAGPVEKIQLYGPDGKALLIKTSWFRQDYPYALALPREELDFILVRQAERMNVQVLEKRRVTDCRELRDDWFAVDVETDSVPPRKGSNAEEWLFTPCFVDASGRNSRLAALARRKSRVETKPGRKVGLQCHVAFSDRSVIPESDLLMFFFRGGYGGVQVVSRGRANLCLWVRPDLAKVRHPNFQAFLDSTLYRNPAAETLCGPLESVEPIAVVSGLSRIHPPDSSEPLIRVGDAVNTVEPFSGFGMAHALKTGYLAAGCIDRGLRNGHSYAQIRSAYYQQYRRLFGAHLKVMQWLHPLLDSNRFQKVVWPWLPPFLPCLTALYR